MDTPTGIPVMLQVGGKRCVVVGGGPVAERRARSLAEAEGEVVLVAPHVEPGILKLRDEGWVQKVHRRGFEPADLDGAFLVVIATNDEAVNDQVSAAAAERGVLVNRTDHRSYASDLTFMASHRQGPLTVCVHTGGASANAAIQIRDTLLANLDPDWPVLLERASDVRDILIDLLPPNERRKALLSLVDEQAMKALKDGGIVGLSDHYQAIIKHHAQQQRGG